MPFALRIALFFRLFAVFFATKGYSLRNMYKPTPLNCPIYLNRLHSILLIFMGIFTIIILADVDR